MIPRGVAAVAGTVAVVGIAAVVSTIVVTHPAREPDGTASLAVAHGVMWHRAHPVHTPPLPTRPFAYLGAYEATSPGSYSGMRKFASATTTHPDLALYYSGWGEPFLAGFARDAHANGAIPFVQIDPVRASLAKIAAGRYDAYLENYADQVADYGHPVIISFGHEMNGSWYSWGYTHVAPAVFVAAWRHIVSVFRLQGADNVTWLWTVNRNGSTTGPVSLWWPGAAYVTWVGIDGYYVAPADVFTNTFDPTIVSIRQFTDDPILIAETAVAPGKGQAAGIRDLFGAIRDQGYLGLVWFDAAQNGSPFRQDWRIEDNAAALAAFRNSASKYAQ